MKLAVIGLSNSGKTTVFNALTGRNLETTIYPTISGEPQFGSVKVPDHRVGRLAEIYKPKKITYAAVEYVDYIGLTKGNISQNRKVFELIKDMDGIVHVVRAFKDSSVSHPLNEVNPQQDVETLELELILGDLEFVETRLKRIDEASKKGKGIDEAEKRLLIKCKGALEEGVPLRNVSLDQEDQRAIKPLQFISTKPEVVVLNADERDMRADNAANTKRDIERYFRERGISETTEVVTLCGKAEMEIAELRPNEAREFLEDLGIKEPALNKLIRMSYALLGLISFFTVVGGELRAWTITSGTTAQKAARKIHSDIERGFIRAEVINYADLVALENISAARERGLLRLEGKTYEVRDGDIINFRFNV
ncbi:redox-regulated ATPase YchF [Thermodesulfovibrionales bacterium]|nr:redox-regulated ATPase YchF [Thermodesulfovibrionales bacterium]MCL0047266.1 redox-regulated ATPase YchF [Thermodesulfovibrionales bacterium]MCL0083486.1 redox-regulated ATPase YchF [Thermodesulfovibrionales bacterium]MCL0096446.1 redox-regulated ATPase YchF [Thermodesulfovibrionales bacterium]